MGALSNLYDADEILWTGCPCGMHATMYEHQAALASNNPNSKFYCAETTPKTDQTKEIAPSFSPKLGGLTNAADKTEKLDWSDNQKVMANVIESSILKGIFGICVE